MNMITESILVKKRRPLISIIISSNNNSEILSKCIESFKNLKKDTRNIEIIIINNFSEDEYKMKEIKHLINRYYDSNLIFYQSNYYLTSAQSKNLGIDFSKGSWLYFVEDHEIATPKFIRFLASFKFDLQKGFYRVPLLNEKYEKQKIGLFKTKYFSDKASSIIVNEEFIERIHLRWESNLNTNETLLFLDRIYSAKNVNFIYLKKCYSVIHNFYRDRKNPGFKDFDNVKQTYNALVKQKKRNYKQFVIILFYNFLSIQTKVKKEEIQEIYLQIKKMMKTEKIYFWNYLPLGPKLYFKTTKLRWKTLF